jgi:hypothetical protein
MLPQPREDQVATFANRYVSINVQIPSGLAPGAAEVVVKVGDASSQSGATLTVNREEPEDIGELVDRKKGIKSVDTTCEF